VYGRRGVCSDALLKVVTLVLILVTDVTQRAGAWQREIRSTTAPCISIISSASTLDIVQHAPACVITPSGHPSTCTSPLGSAFAGQQCMLASKASGDTSHADVTATVSKQTRSYCGETARALTQEQLVPHWLPIQLACSLVALLSATVLHMYPQIKTSVPQLSAARVQLDAYQYMRKWTCHCVAVGIAHSKQAGKAQWFPHMFTAHHHHKSHDCVSLVASIPSSAPVLHALTCVV
jgi:hypothetical protein